MTTSSTAIPATGDLIAREVFIPFTFLFYFRKNFGPKGYGFGGGAGTLSMDDGKGYQTKTNQVKKRVFMSAENTCREFL